MAKANAKKRAEENAARISRLFYVLLGSIVIFTAVRLVLYRATTRWWFQPTMGALTAGAAWFCYRSLAYIAAPSFDAGGALTDGGADLSMGGMSSYYHDVIYIAVFLLLSTALVSDWFWLLGLVVPGYALYMLWTSVLAPWIFNPTADELEAKNRSSESREDKRKRERAERKENGGRPARR